MSEKVKKSKMTLEKLAATTQREFLHLSGRIEDIRESMATKDDLKHFATKDDLRTTEVKILQAVDKIATRFDKKEKEEAAHTSLHKHVDDELHHHDQRIKKIEAKISVNFIK